MSVLKYKPQGRISIVNILSTIIFLLVILLLISTLMFFAAILHTYNVFTQEQIVALIEVSELKEKNGIPYFEIRYEPYENASGFWSVIGVDTPSSSIEVVQGELVGDQVFFRTDFIRWSNFMTLLNFKPVYKVYAIRSDFDNLADFDKYKDSIKSSDREIVVNDGRDSFIRSLQSNSQYLTWLAQGTFISSSGIDISESKSQKFYLIATEDAMVIEPMRK